MIYYVTTYARSKAFLAVQSVFQVEENGADCVNGRVVLLHGSLGANPIWVKIAHGSGREVDSVRTEN